MIDSQVVRQVKSSNEAYEISLKNNLGFWVYLMTDCVLFASLFAVYAVLHNNTFGGPNGASIFNLPLVLSETILLLTSSLTCGFAVLAAKREDLTKVLYWLGMTFLLGIGFLTLELSDFNKLIQAGDSWRKSGFLSSYFTLVGTHGLHITIGLIWMLIMIIFIYRRGLTTSIVRKINMLAVFWHFLDLIWIFIFTIVYLMGVIAK